MPTYFSLKECKLDRFAKDTQRLTESGIEWRRLNDVNLKWAVEAVKAGIAKEDADNEKLGLAILFVIRLESIHTRDPLLDRYDEVFGTWEGDF